MSLKHAFSLIKEKTNWKKEFLLIVWYLFREFPFVTVERGPKYVECIESFKIQFADQFHQWSVRMSKTPWEEPRHAFITSSNWKLLCAFTFHKKRIISKVSSEISKFVNLCFRLGQDWRGTKRGTNKQKRKHIQQKPNVYIKPDIK